MEAKKPELRQYLERDYESIFSTFTVIGHLCKNTFPEIMLKFFSVLA